MRYGRRRTAYRRRDRIGKPTRTTAAATAILVGRENQLPNGEVYHRVRTEGGPKTEIGIDREIDHEIDRETDREIDRATDRGIETEGKNYNIFHCILIIFKVCFNL